MEGGDLRDRFEQHTHMAPHCLAGIPAQRRGSSRRVALLLVHVWHSGVVETAWAADSSTRGWPSDLAASKGYETCETIKCPGGHWKGR